MKMTGVVGAMLLSAGVAGAQQDSPADRDGQTGGLDRSGTSSDDSGGASERTSSGNAFNPALSVILDGTYRNRFSGEAADPAGFDGGHDHGHEHGHGVEDGFELRETEIALSGSIDNYFSGTATLAVSSDGDVELEEAFLTTLGLPAGLQIKFGKFLSDIGYINSRHAHEWDFVDRPLINELLFGDHGLQETGAQLSWLAPLPFYARFGVEALQGDSEGVARQVDDTDAFGLDDDNGPRLVTAFAKFSPDLGYDHALQFGLSGGYGSSWQHGEVHDGGAEVRAWDGDAWFAGADLVYKYDAGRQYGHGDWTVQGEYFYREIDVDFTEDDAGTLTAFSDQSQQDGIYLQTLYGFAPRWHAGLRAEAVGLTNRSLEPHDGRFETFDTSYRYSGQVSFVPTEFSRVRFQVSHEDYAGADHDHGHDDGSWIAMLQYSMSLGAHGAHDF